MNVALVAGFERVEVCTQWIFSGLSHRSFLEWSRRWRESMELNAKVR